MTATNEMTLFTHPKLALSMFVVAVFSCFPVMGQIVNAPTPKPGITKAQADQNDLNSAAKVDEAHALVSKGNIDAALKVLTDVIQSNVTFAPAYSLRASIYASIEKMALALADADTSLSLDPQNFEAYTVRGGIKAKKNDLPGCVADETQAIKLQPTYVRPFYLRSLCNETLQNFQATYDDSAKVMQMAPTFAGGYVEHGSAAFSLGKFEQAIDDLQKAVDLDPADDKAHDYFVAAVNGNRKFTADLIEGRDKLAQDTFATFADRLTLFQKEMTTASTTKCNSLNELIGDSASLASLGTARAFRT